MSSMTRNKATKLDVSQLTQAQATLLMPLWARALESRRVDALLRDPVAEQILDGLRFEFEQFHAKSVPAVDYCLRASIIDQLVQRFIDEHPAGVVVELGVGLDTRFDRLNNQETTWVELDLPAVMRVRCQFFETSPRRHMIAASLGDQHWFHQVADVQGNRPTLFISEGVLYFFQPLEVRAIIARLATHFPGSGLVFDAQSPWFLWLSNWRHPLDDSRLKFSLGDVHEMESWDERLRVRQCIGFGDSPYYDAGMRRLSLVRRWGRRLLPFVRNFFKIVEVGW